MMINFQHFYPILKEAGVQFNIYYDVSTCYYCDEENQYLQPEDNCLGGGRYCEYYLDPNAAVDGVDLLMEITR